MPLVECADCGSVDIDLLDQLADGRKRVECKDCGAVWTHGHAIAPVRRFNTFESLRNRFPGPADVDPAVMARVDVLKAEFLATVRTDPDPRVAPYWDKYQQVFSRTGLAEADPQDFKDFANSNIGANPGNMSVFNTAWNEMGPEAGAAEVRDAVGYLLYGTDRLPLEDRLTNLIDGTAGVGMTGFKEALLTRVLCVAEPDRFLTILKYTGEAGKREIARSLYGLDLPDPARVDWTIGRLILWSNDVLMQLTGSGFTNAQHAAAFLWWAKDRLSTAGPTS